MSEDLIENVLEDLLEDIRTTKAKRPCGFWFVGSTKDAREWTERNVTESLLDGLNSHLHVANKYSLDSLNTTVSDPPDCEVCTEDDMRVGIEVTEVVRNEYFQNENINRHVYWEWTFDEFKVVIQSRVTSKDSKLEKVLVAGGYDKILLLIHTDEVRLDYQTVKSWVGKLSTQHVVAIDEAYLITSYHPSYGYGVVALPVLRA